MDDIGKQVGMLKDSLYAHVSRKEEIVGAAAREFAVAVTPWCIARSLPETSMATRCERPRVRHGGAASTAASPGWIGESQRRYERLWRHIVERGVQTGSRTSLNAAALAHVQPRLSEQALDTDRLASDRCTAFPNGYRRRTLRAARPPARALSQHPEAGAGRRTDHGDGQEQRPAQEPAQGDKEQHHGQCIEGAGDEDGVDAIGHRKRVAP